MNSKCVSSGGTCALEVVIFVVSPREKNQEERCLNFELCSRQSKEVIEDGEKKASWSQWERFLEGSFRKRQGVSWLPTFAAFNLRSEERKKTQRACVVGHSQHMLTRGLYFHSLREAQPRGIFPGVNMKLSQQGRIYIDGNVMLAKEMIRKGWVGEDDYCMWI